MKSIFSLAFAILVSLSLSAQSDAIERFFKDYQEDKNFSVVYVAPKMFQMVSKITSEEYEELVTIKEKDSNIRFVTKESNGTISELLLLVGGNDEFVLMSFVGNIDLNKIAKLAKKLDIDGAEHLDKVKKK